MVSFLHSKGDITSQGTGNIPTPQEASFATLLENSGYEFTVTDPSQDGYYYKYQLEGSQRSKDFELIEFDSGKIKRFTIDLKHSKGKSFYLNDGWFHKDIVYIVSWTSKKKDKIFIGLGQDIPTPEENKRFDELTQLKQTFNSGLKKTDSLRVCMRYANQYSCDKFTDEYSVSKFTSVLKFLETL
jgi:hypothetical protein